MKNNKKIKSAFLSILIVITLSSCDQINPPYEQTNSHNTDTTTKNVLLEEYTGFRCGNCPPAAVVAHQIKQEYGDKVVVVAIHVGQLAMPTPQHKYDFRTAIGNTLDDFYKIGSEIGTPNGLVDRIPYNGNLVLGYSSWEAAIIARLQEKANMTIEFVNANYDSTKKSISTKLKINFIDKCLTNYKLAVYIVEDSIVNYQTDYFSTPNDIPDYVHNNVLRGALTDAWGSQISDTELSAGTESIKDFSYSVPANTDWRMNWVRLVAIITNADTKEVLQVNEKYLNIK